MSIPPHFDLSGRIALVTGGSRGLGYEIAMAFARHGADLVIASRKLDACVAVARDIEALGRRALPVACHVGRWADIEAMVDTVYREWGRIDTVSYTHLTLPTIYSV